MLIKDNTYTQLRASFSLSKDTAAIKILVVEDNQLVQFVISSMLEDLGYRFDIAPDGFTAIECAHQCDDYALVLMDIDLPDMSGIQVTEVLLSLANTKNVPIVAMTSHTGPEYAARCYAAQMVGFYNKPRTKDDIKNIINTHIGINKTVTA